MVSKKEVEVTGSSGSKFSSQHPYEIAQSTVTPAPEDLMPSSELHGHLHSDTHTHNLHKENPKEKSNRREKPRDSGLCRKLALVPMRQGTLNSI